MTRMRPSKCTHCGKKYIHADLHMNICEAKPTQPTQDPKCPACKNGVEAKKTIVGEVELLCKAHLDELNGHLTTLVTPATKPLDEQIQDIFNDNVEDVHPYGIEYDLPAVTTAIKALITNAEKQARNTPTHIMGKTIDEVCGILAMLDMERLAEMQLTMANLHKWYKLLAEEQKAMLEKSITDRIKELENL